MQLNVEGFNLFLQTFISISKISWETEVRTPKLKICHFIEGHNQIHI